MERGYIQIYTGDGKGKTTAALGLALRAVGRGLKVVMVQFLKGSFTGELESAKSLYPNFEIIRLAETNKFFSELDEEERLELKERAQKEIEFVKDSLMKGNLDILILDEIMGLIHSGLVTVEKVCQIIDAKPMGMELVLTGRNVPDAIAQRGDLITEMKPIKHYMDEGVPARCGIEL